MNSQSITAPRFRSLVWEGTAALEIPKLLLRAPKLLQLRNALSSPEVLVLPGFGADDHSTYMMRQFLTFAGAEAWGWDMGINRGDVEALVPQLVHKIEQMAERTHEKIHLVGWSLGGVLAREVAREIPNKIEQVISMGTPIVGGPRYTVFAKLYEKQGYDLEFIEAKIEERNQTPIHVPVTAMYSKHDHVVAWQACIDGVNKSTRHLEVEATHLGMGFSAEVYENLVLLLAGMEDDEMWLKNLED